MWVFLGEVIICSSSHVGSVLLSLTYLWKLSRGQLTHMIATFPKIAWSSPYYWKIRRQDTSAHLWIHVWPASATLARRGSRGGRRFSSGSQHSLILGGRRKRLPLAGVVFVDDTRRKWHGGAASPRGVPDVQTYTQRLGDICRHGRSARLNLVSSPRKPRSHTICGVIHLCVMIPQSASSNR